MFNLSSFSTIFEKVRMYMNDYSLENMSIAFQRFALETILSLNEDEIEDAITDGAMDGGIDAIYISDRDVHIFNFKYAESFDKSKNNFPGNEIDKIIVTMDSIYGKSLTNDDVNQLLWDKVLEIWDLFEKGHLNFKYYLCSNMQKPVDNAKRKLETALNRFRYVEYYYYDQEDLVSKVIEKKYKAVDGTVRFIDKQYFDRSDGPLRGIVATIAAIDLINLIQDPNDSDKIVEDVFNDNVRVYLKLKNRINRGIYETALSEDNFEFWYLNNGISIVCEECIYTPGERTPTVQLKNFQIVNGGQTTHALFEAYMEDKSKIDNVLVLVRIYETKKNYKISERISETTNSQTPIRSRDLHANDRIQKKLEEQFRDLGFFYERKKNQYEGEPKNKRLNNELLGQIYLAYYLDMPSRAKDQKVLVFGDKYDDIFDEDIINAQKMLVPYKIYLPFEKMKKEIQKKKRNKVPIDEREAFISRATFHLINAIKFISEKEQLDLKKNKDLDKAISKAINFVGEVAHAQATEIGETYTHDKFFKETPTEEKIRKYVLSKYI